MSEAPRIALYVQHLLGIGHLRRAAALARAYAEAGAEVLVLSGGIPVADIEFGPVAVRQLPPCLAADATFSALLDDSGHIIDSDWKDRRRALLLKEAAAFKPDALVIEMYPFGRRQFRFELLPLLYWAQNAKLLVASSVRDILVDKGRDDRVMEAADLVRRYFDLVLVHGDPRLVPFERTFPRAAAIADRLHYTGYVIEKPKAVPSADRSGGEVLVSAGGGAVGWPLFAAALAARRLSGLKDRVWRFVAGRNLPEADFAVLRKAAAIDPSIVVDRFRADFTELLANCHVSLSQGGYNTVMELLALKVPAVIVPFAEGQESEQRLRAELLAERGALDMLDSTNLDPALLAATLTRRAQKGALPIDLDLDGARHSAQITLSALAKKQAAAGHG
ncbi:glycosyltransferase family protein [Dongia sp.]|uniref:glycosyltransferase family protein n=1 Tax=Dongia sp. TaxID=1977262 RepID=UPI0035AFA21F